MPLRASSPRAPRLSWSLQKHEITSYSLPHLCSLEPVSRCCYSSSDPVEGQQEGWHGHQDLSLPRIMGVGDWQARQGFTSLLHQGISGICIKLEPKTSFSKAPHTITTKKPKQVFKSGKNSIVMKKRRGVSQKYTYHSGLFAQKILISYRPCVLFSPLPGKT